MATLRDYLTLIRFPNLFTVPSNVIVGFVQLFTLSKIETWNLVALITISVLLYIIGIILNDYFDINVDRRERPSRPLPSGRISTRAALTIVLFATFSVIVLSSFISTFTIIISSIILITILAYDYWLKNTIYGSFTIATSRVLNVTLGFSQAIFTIPRNEEILIRVIVILVSMFIYVTALTYLSRFEVGILNSKTNILTSLVLISLVPILAGTFTIIGFFKLDLFLNLTIFVLMILYTFINWHRSLDSFEIRKVVKNLVLSIIILDSVFISGTIGFEYGLLLMLMLAPAILFSRKFYVT
ncbi:MAG TPA: UbiA family prenyltransferase [Nitrososphaeraceae archaeon]